jgi:hypothetical protein
MPRRPKFTLIFAPEAIDHLDTIERKYHSLIERAIDEQLSYTPIGRLATESPWKSHRPSMPDGN